MQEKIPKISFRTPQNKLAVELVDIRELPQRIDPNDHYPNKPHRLDFFVILVVTAGRGKHYIDFQTYTLEKGDVLVISKGQIHAFDGSFSFEGYLIVFTEAFILDFFSQNTIRLVSHLYNYHVRSPLFHQVPFSIETLDQIREELANESSFGKSNMIAAILTLYLLRLERTFPKPVQTFSQNRHYELFQSFRTLVERNFSQTRNGSDYANELSISYKLLNEVSKTFTQKTAKQFIDDYIILEAKRKLISTSLSVKEISYACGFEEPSNFAKFFKKHTHQTPYKFRESLLGG
ncbi:MAG: helix-turn-helix transcriptional regulator [Bacteroidota bacterium]